MHTALDLAALAALADEYFEQHPDVYCFHATSDGQFFPDGKERFAEDHAKRNALGEVVVFGRTEDGSVQLVAGTEETAAPHASESGTNLVDAPAPGSDQGGADAATAWKERFGVIGQLADEDSETNSDTTASNA